MIGHITFIGTTMIPPSSNPGQFAILHVSQLEVPGDMYLKTSSINVRIFYIEKNLIGLNIHLGRGKN